MIGAIVAAAILAGFAFGWAVVPLVAAAAFLVCLGRGNKWAFGALVIAAAMVGAVQVCPRSRT